jgi:CRISPR/Cas system-associated protein endoribonuclease Cas2
MEHRYQGTTCSAKIAIEPNLRKCAHSDRHRSAALYQGTTLVGPYRGSQRGLQPLRSVFAAMRAQLSHLGRLRRTLPPKGRIGRLRRTLPPKGRIRRLRRTLPPKGRIRRLRRTLPPKGRIGRLRRTLPPKGRIRRLRRTLPPKGRIGRLRRTLPPKGRIGRLRRTLPPKGRIGRLRRTLPPKGRIRRLRRTLPPKGRIRRLGRTLPPRSAAPFPGVSKQKKPFFRTVLAPYGTFLPTNFRQAAKEIPVVSTSNVRHRADVHADTPAGTRVTSRSKSKEKKRLLKAPLECWSSRSLTGIDSNPMVANLGLQSCVVGVQDQEL